MPSFLKFLLWVCSVFEHLNNRRSNTSAASQLKQLIDFSADNCCNLVGGEQKSLFRNVDIVVIIFSFLSFLCAKD